MPTIEPDIQEAIVKVLPANYDMAIAIMCQLLANMMLCDKGMSIVTVRKLIEANLAAYEGT